MRDRKEGGFVFGNYRANQSIPIGSRPPEDKEARSRSSGGTPVIKKEKPMIIARMDEVHDLNVSKTPTTIKGELNMTKMDQLAVYLNQGMTVRQAADKMGAKASTLNQYFYSLKRDNKIGGTPHKPIIVKRKDQEDQRVDMEKTVADSVAETLNPDIPKEERMGALIEGINNGLDQFKKEQSETKPSEKESSAASTGPVTEEEYGVSSDLVSDYQKKVDAFNIPQSVLDRVKKLHSAGATFEGIAKVTLLKTATVREVIVLTTLKENEGLSKKELKRVARKFFLTAHDATFIAMVTQIPYEKVSGIFASLKENGELEGTANAPVVPIKQGKRSSNPVPKPQNEESSTNAPVDEKTEESFTAAEMTPPEIKEQEYIETKSISNASTSVSTQDELKEVVQNVLNQNEDLSSKEAAVTTEAPKPIKGHLMSVEEVHEEKINDIREVIKNAEYATQAIRPGIIPHTPLSKEDLEELRKRTEQQANDFASPVDEKEVTLDEALDRLHKIRKKIMMSGMSSAELEDKYMHYYKKNSDSSEPHEHRLIIDLLRQESLLVKRFDMRLYDINPNAVRRFISAGKACGYPLVSAMRDFELTIEEVEELGFWEVGQKIEVVEFNENLTDIPNQLEAEFDGQVSNDVPRKNSVDLVETMNEYLQAEASRKIAAELAKVVEENSTPITSHAEPEERIFIDTKLAVKHRRVSVATARKHIEKMLDMIEMTGELADVHVELSTARLEEDEVDQ